MDRTELTKPVALILAAALLIAGCGSSGGGQHKNVAGVDPSRFGTVVDNPWFPLKPGTTFRYRGTKDGKPAVDVFRVTGATKMILGVRCVVVRDNLYLAGRLAEQTQDWYAQDRAGNVWYFGERTRELDRKGRTTTTEGSWQSGVKGARPGVYMPADPKVGDSFQQEYFKGQAEDRFKVLSLNASVRVPYGSYRNRALLTREWTPLEPGVVDHKYYVRGVGQVKEVTAKGPFESGELVSVTRE